MAEKKIKWTEQQKRAITARGSDVLVTASAGTGKTAVLSGRCVDLVGDKTDVWSMLVLTFTEMAAEQMRSRIAEQLRAAFLKNQDPHLRHQLILLQGADISTIHSFCKRLITEYFYKLGLDPTFRVIDADEARLLKAEVLEKTIDWAWEQSNLVPALQQLLSRRDLRTNDGFLSKVIDLSDFLDSVVWRESWYERTTRLAEAANPFATDLGRKQKQIIAEKLQHILNQLRSARKLCQNQNPKGDWALKCEDTFIKPVAECIELLEADDWDRCAEKIRNFEKPRINKPKDVTKTVAELIQKTVKKAVDSFERLSELAMVNPDYLDKVSSSAGLQTKVLVELVKKFDLLYGGAKRGINCLDFADLEHYALKLLTDEESSEDNLSASKTALLLRRRYKYIFVDEYQDINPVQQTILDMLSCEGNVFVVGDVKQSIYSWRGAQPEIFIKRLGPASVDPVNVPNGLRVDLNSNFRSAKGILDFVNKVFSRIMTKSFAKIDYDKSALLKPAVSTRAANAPVVEFHILDEMGSDKDLENGPTNQIADDENLNIISSRQRQAAMIAQRIRQIVGSDTRKCEFQIYDKQQDCLRDVEYRDIVILMRSLAKKANDYVEVLRLAGVPVSCEATAGYFEATEISDVVALLKVLDNPQRDIELAAVLRSPFFKVSDTELAKIKIHSKKAEHNENFYSCVLQYCNNGPDVKLTEKLKTVLAEIEQWRTAARRGDLADMIWRIYHQTGFLSFVSALPNGQARRANLLKLHDRAIQFEGFAGSAGHLSLKRFVEFIEKLQEVGQDWAPAEPDASAGNAVRILSVHKSKGLEFPVVFLAELDSQFNKRDIYSDFLADADDTLGLQIIDHKSNSKLRSLAHQVIAEHKLSTALAEEMRILYVATTRARDRLILSASEKKKRCHDIVCNGFFLGQKRISDWQLRTCRNPLDWVLYGLCDQKVLHEAFETGLDAQADDNDLFRLELYGAEEIRKLAAYILKLKTDRSLAPPPVGGARLAPTPAVGVRLSQVKKSLGWQYGFGDAPMLPAKQSVTGLTHQSSEYVKINYFGALDRRPIAVMASETGLAKPVEGRLIGTAFHLLIAQLDLTKPVSKDAVEKTKEKLLADGAMIEAVAKHINTGSIVEFFESQLGQKVFEGHSDVWREWPFTFALPAVARASSPLSTARMTVPLSTSDEIIVVQGIIDMLIRTPEGLVIIDFKTDKINAGQVSERAELYRQQLDLYGRAAGAIMKEKLLAKWLYFLTPATEFEIK
ncbi:MAG: helicase-exonuclease AddAB subunit AddA [Planctomycetes bacterium]|nr:helicase-exonuclease AddAB subunit AddA [Planctomycetota bacterium]